MDNSKLIPKVKIIKWWDKKKDIILFGVDIFINNQWSHVKFGKDRRTNFFKTRVEAAHAKQVVINSFKSTKQSTWITR